METLLTKHLDIWTTAQAPKAGSGRGRKSNGTASPHGIQKLRELILELAVRGKLVPRDPKDEPASVLLEKIAKEKARLIKEGKIKKQKKLPEISAEEKPFELPEGWEWVRLGIITSKITDGDHKTPPRIPEGHRLLSAKNVRDGYLDFDNCDFISEQHYLKSRERCLPETGDLLVVSVGGTIGRTSLVPDESNFSLVRSVALVKPLLFNSLYLRYAMNSDLLQSSIHGRKRGGAQPCLYLSEIAQFLFPFPPLTEQQRIVAKVDELMALCDQLEQQQSDSGTTHQALLETLLTTLTSAADHGEFIDTWQRIEAHFHTLFTTEDSIDQLKQTILQLAVMGKLVPQNPADEPARVLLEEIAKEKARLIKEGKIKKQKKLPAISAEEKPFALPKGWEWVKFGLLAEFINGDRGKNYPNRSEYVTTGIPWINTGHIEPNGTLTTIGMNFISRDKYESLRGGKIQKGDLVYCLRGATFGKTAFVTPYEEGAIASSLMIIRPYLTEIKDYLFKYLTSTLGRDQLSRFDNGTAQPNLSANSVKLYAFPLPPLPEQHRIVAKVDELMALCDSLKANLAQAQTTRFHLADAMVEQALA